MTHPLVLQLKFAREKFWETLVDISAEHAIQRFGRMNSISWMIGHLAQFEQWSWLELPGQPNATTIFEQYDFYAPNVNPPYDEMVAGWHQVIDAVNPVLEAMTDEDMHIHHMFRGKPIHENVGTRIQRHVGHYWYHNGEANAIRQLIDDRKLPQMIGRIPNWAAYDLNA